MSQISVQQGTQKQYKKYEMGRNLFKKTLEVDINLTYKGTNFSTTKIGADKKSFGR